MVNARKMTYLISTFFILVLMTTQGVAAPVYDLAVPAFKGRTQYPAVFKGLQHILIDDLRAAMDQRVMPREDIQAAIEANGLTAPIFSTQLKHLKFPIPVTYLLLNEVTEVDHQVVWKARLVQADSGYVEAAWRFQQHVSKLSQLKNQVVAAVLQKTLQTPPEQAQPGRNLNLPAVMAFSKKLEAGDRVRAQATSEAGTPRVKGFLSLSKGQDRQAKAHFQTALNQNPDDVDVLVAMTRIEQANGRPRQAKSYAEQAQRLQPERAETWAALGQMAKAEGRTGDAQQLLEKARQLNPAQPDVHVALGEIYERTGNTDAASNAYRQAGQRYGNALDTEAALQAFGQAAKITPRDAGLFLQQGDLHALAGRTEQAQSAYAAAKELTPNNAEVYQKLGELAQQAGERNKALVNFEKAVKLQPQHGPANFKLGDIYLKDGRADKALPYLQQARQSRPRDVEASKALGRAYNATGQHELAQGEYQHLLGLAPKDPEVYTGYGDSFAHQGDYAQAQLQYEKAAAFDPDSSMAYRGLGVTYKALGHETEANQAFTQAQKLNPGVALPSDADIIHAGIVNFLESFPVVQSQEGMAKIALVTTEPLIAKERGLHYRFNQVRRFFQLRRADIQYVADELEQSLTQTYTLIDPRQINRVLVASPYDRMTSHDLTNRDYLKDLSAKLQADALLFYRIVGLGIADEGVRFKVSAMLFDQQRQAMWMNESEIAYAKKAASFWNRPLLLALGILIHALLFYAVIYWLQGFGNLRVTIEQDKRKEIAYFTILLSKNENKDLTKIKKRLSKKIKRRRNKKLAYELQESYSSYYQSMVVREAQFKRVHAGKYHVYLYGVLTDGGGVTRLAIIKCSKK